MVVAFQRSLAGAAVLAALAVLPARAETAKPFTVGATIAQGCAVVTNSSGAGTFGNINLGTVSGLSAGTASGNLLSSSLTGVQLNCTPGVTASISADQGNQASGGMRRLVHTNQAGSLIPYQLYANNSATPWTNQSISVAFAAGVQSRTLPVQAIASLSGTTRGGDYSDTVRVTVSW